MAEPAYDRFVYVWSESYYKKLVHRVSLRYYKGLEKKLDLSDLEQECWTKIWDICGDIDPKERPDEFCACVNHVLKYHLVSSTVRYLRTRSRDIGLEDGEEATENLRSETPGPESIVAMREYLNRLESAVLSTRDERLIAVFMSFMYPGPDVQEEEEKYLAERGWSYTKRTPEVVLAKTLNMNPRVFRWYRRKIRRIALAIK